MVVRAGRTIFDADVWKHLFTCVGWDEESKSSCELKITALCSFSAGEHKQPVCGNFNCESCHWNLAQALWLFLDPNLVENEWNNFGKWVILQQRNGQPISYKISTSDNSNHQKGINFCLYSFCNLQRFNGPLLLWGYFLDSKSDRLWGGNDCPQVFHVYLSRIPLLWLCMLCMQLFDWGLKFCIGMITSEAERHSCQLTELSAVERANVESDDKAAFSFARCLSFWAQLYVTGCMRISAEWMVNTYVWSLKGFLLHRLTQSSHCIQSCW